MKIQLSIAVLCITTSVAFANPSGLNNIPTADTVPQGDLVLQSYGTVGSAQNHDFSLGFKTGIDTKIFKFELGADSHILPREGGPVTVQGKVAIPFGQGLPTLALGAANVSFSTHDRERTGDVFGYGVLSQDFGFLRVHGGCGFQGSGDLPFFGVDKTFSIHKQKPVARDGKSSVDGKDGKDGKDLGDGKTAMETRDLFTLRADAIQQQNHTWLSSVGVLVPVCKYFVFETWGNFPSDGTPASVTLKADFVIHF